MVSQQRFPVAKPEYPVAKPGYPVAKPGGLTMKSFVTVNAVWLRNFIVSGRPRSECDLTVGSSFDDFCVGNQIVKTASFARKDGQCVDQRDEVA